MLLIPNNFWGFTAIWARLGIASEKIAYVNTQKSNDVSRSYFRDAPRMMTSKLMTYLFGVGVMKNNFIYQVTNDVMSKLVQNGIPQHFLNYIREVILRELPRSERAPKKFNFDDLKFGFMIFLKCCGISIVVFVIEVGYFHAQKLICAMVVLRSVLNQQ